MTDWSKLKVVDLKAELKTRGLPQNGLKSELVARLEAADQEGPEQVESEDVQDSPAKGAEEGGGEGQDLDEAPVDEAEAAPADVAPVVTEDAVVEEPVNSVTAGSAEVQDDSNNDVTPVGDKEPAKQAIEISTDENPFEPLNTIQEPEPAPLAVPETSIPSVTEIPGESGTSTEPVSESQKRKRRSASPQPLEEDLARKRARPEDATDISGNIAPAVRLVDEADLPPAQNIDPDEAMEDRPDENPTTSAQNNLSERVADEMDYARDIVPSLHPATSALYINNLMRPLRPMDVRAHLANLATPPKEETNDNIIVNFYLDQVRTHAFVVFESVSAASRARTALHDCVWPNESNRKALWVDFVPPDKIEGWIDMEETSRGGRSGSRWEVVYENGPDGVIEARLESGAISSSRSGPAPTSRSLNPPVADGPNSIPVGPRGYRDSGPPTGPRAVRPGTGPGPRPPPNTLDGFVERTRAQPSISYQQVSDDLAARRTENMRSFYTKDDGRDLGREINRYSFEEGDSFVDRGKEIFEGIRPPHRERAMDRDRRGGGRGGYGGRPPPRRGPPPFRQRSDRYLPGLTDSRDDRRLPRRGDDRGSFRPRDRDRR